MVSPATDQGAALERNSAGIEKPEAMFEGTGCVVKLRDGSSLKVVGPADGFMLRPAGIPDFVLVQELARYTYRMQVDWSTAVQIVCEGFTAHNDRLYLRESEIVAIDQREFGWSTSTRDMTSWRPRKRWWRR